jgi:hypothetical protein
MVDRIARQPAPDDPAPADPLAVQRQQVFDLLNGRHPDAQGIWTDAVKQIKAELPGMFKARALALAGLAERQPRADNTSGHRGIDWHRGKWRARVWRGGRVVFNRSSLDKGRAIAARLRFLAGQQ